MAANTTDLHPYNVPLAAGVYQGSPKFYARVVLGGQDPLPGMPRAWADKAVALLNACETRNAQWAEVARIRKAIAGKPGVEA